MPLLNPFIRSIVCVGFNSDRGLIIDRESDDNSSPFLSFLKPYVLSILTADQALYPQSKTEDIIDKSYPPIRNSNTTSKKKDIQPNSFDYLPIFCSPDGVKVSHQHEESRIHHIVFTQEEGTRSYAVVLTFQQKFSLKTDKPDDDGIYQIESVTQPTKKQVKRIPSSYRHANSSVSNNSPSSNGVAKKQHPDDSSNSNSRSFDSPDTNGTSRMRRSNSLTSLSNRKSTSIIHDALEPFYLPHCVVLVSSYPYWTVMQELISIIYDEIHQNEIQPGSDTYKSLLRKYAFLACNTPVPPIAWERFSLSFYLRNHQSILTLDPPLHTNRTVLDLDLSTLLLTLNIGKLLDVLAAIFTQQPIFFFSSDYSKLVTTLECLLYLIYPLKWIHAYIPLLPDSLRDYLEGPPGSFIMGVHSRHQVTVEKLDISIVCNLDNDKHIHIPSSVEFHRIPPTKLRRFINPITEFIEHIKKTRSLQNVHAPVRLHLDEQREYERKHRLETNEKIIEIFLDLMVDLFDDTLKPIYWTIDHPRNGSTNSLTRPTATERKNSIHNPTKFCKQTYLRSKTEGVEREFYRLVIITTAFEIFIEKEIASTAQTEFQKICQLRSELDHDQPYHIHKQLTAKSSMPLFDSTSTKMLLRLPDWSSDASTHYLDSCIDIFTIELKNAKKEHSLPLITVYGYLRGCALLARGHLLDGLHDLYLTENRNLFPKDYIETTVVPLLIDAFLFDIFLHEQFYIKSPEWKKIQTQLTDDSMLTISIGQSTNHTGNAMPVTPTTEKMLQSEYDVIEDSLSFEQFNKHVHHLSIVFDRETADILFKSLLHWIDKPHKSVETNKVSRRWSISGNSSNENTNHQRDKLPFNLTLPANLFNIFLQTWQQTNAEKARMNSLLPKDRQKQESILMISSSDITLKKADHGKLILTQRGIYFLPEGRSSALLLTELLKIVLIEKFEQKTMIFVKHAIRIFAFHSSASTNSSASQRDAEPTAVLIFKDTQEQNFWQKVMHELWTGVLTAQEQCDTTVFHKAARHIALIDTLTKIDYNELPSSTTDGQTTKASGKSKHSHNQVNLDTMLNDFTIFTRMQNCGTSKKLTDETRKALHDRLSPSINETERHAVRCLVFNDNSANEYPLLWCAYGSKLKIFNAITWICDPHDLHFPSIITCMCLDACETLWVGCLDGKLFVIDTNQRICGAQIAAIEGKGGCQAMTFDTIRSQMLIATRSGLIIRWDAINKQRLVDINLEDIYNSASHAQGRKYKSEIQLKPGTLTERSTFTVSSPTTPNETILTPTNRLKSIQIYANRVFACYHDDYILIFGITESNTYLYEDKISVKYKTDCSMPINSFLIYNQQLWISASYIIYVYRIDQENNRNSYKLIMKKHLADDHLLTMLGFSDHIWAGSLCGNVYIFRMDNYELVKMFNGHKDGVRCLCPMLDKYVISGSQQDDTSIVIWENAQASGGLNATRL